MGVRQDEGIDIRMGARLAARSDHGLTELVQTHRALSCGCCSSHRAMQCDAWLSFTKGNGGRENRVALSVR